MPGYRYAFLPATNLVLRQYAGPLWRDQPLADAQAEHRPHPHLPPPWVLAYADWRARLDTSWIRFVEELTARIGPRAWLRYVVGVPALVGFLGLVLLALLAGLALSPLLGLGWAGARLAGGPAGGLRYGHTLGFLLTADIADLKHYDAPTNYPGEDVPAAIAEARKYGYRVAVYALPGSTPIQDAGARLLLAEGAIDAYWPGPLPENRAAFAARYGVNVANSVVVVPDKAEARCWKMRGFGRAPHRGRCRIWQPGARAAEGASVKHSNRAYSRRRALKSQLHNPFPDTLTVRTLLGLPGEVVLWLEPTGTPDVVRAFFRRHEARIRASLAAEGKQLLRWPDAGSAGGPAPEPDGHLLALLTYAHPALRTAPPDALARAVRTLQEHLTAAQFAAAVAGALDLPELGGALWLRVLDDFWAPTVRAHRFVPPADLRGAAATDWLAERLEMCLPRIGRHPLDGASFSHGPISDEERASADYRFAEDGQRLPPELVAQIAALKAAAPEGALFELLLHIADQLAETHPAVKQTLLPLLRPPATPVLIGAPVLSPLVIDAHHRLWLPAFGNLEIKLPPLPKTLLLFFLQRPPVGLMLHDLTDHQPALLALYQQLQPDLAAATARARIADLVDVRANSINEKCSRIKEAFVREMADDVASQYYITGERGGPKGVLLPRELVQWPA